MALAAIKNEHLKPSYLAHTAEDACSPCYYQHYLASSLSIIILQGVLECVVYVKANGSKNLWPDSPHPQQDFAYSVVGHPLNRKVQYYLKRDHKYSHNEVRNDQKQKHQIQPGFLVSIFDEVYKQIDVAYSTENKH
ncbi:hypothetical protein TNCV_1918131 [Trichonephila clavipes]|nr:hypothetical protein TNCV_1918131 [Trichonephila clavipes]